MNTLSYSLITKSSSLFVTVTDSMGISSGYRDFIYWSASLVPLKALNSVTSRASSYY